MIKKIESISMLRRNMADIKNDPKQNCRDENPKV